MKAALQLKLSQSLTLTPQLQQSIKLLQLSTLDLNQEIERYLAENPLLEREDEGGDEPALFPVAADGGPASVETTESQDAREVNDAPAETSNFEEDDAYWSEASGPRRNGDDEDFDPHANVSREYTLREHLLSQLGLLPLSTRDHALCTLIIEALDEAGYLEQPLEELLDMLPAEWRAQEDIGLDDLRVAWQIVRQLDPCGVGAVDLADCLKLQLLALPSNLAARQLAISLAEQHLALLANKDYSKLKRLLKCDDAALKAAQQLIQQLTPRPGARFGAADTRYVVADVVVRKTRRGWVAQLNSAAQPRLKVNQHYAALLRQHRDGGSNLGAQLQEAKWLVKNIQQRFDTILRVAQAIVERQQQFFEHGEVGMRPLVLRDIAEQLSLHESTVSRVTTQKYMLTPRGIYEFKYFFGSHVETDTGGECSATAIKALIRQLIQNEDGRKPLSDSALADALAKQGINVARRTVAKYREAMQIPPVNLRKSL